MTISGDYVTLNGGIRHGRLANICQLSESHCHEKSPASYDAPQIIRNIGLETMELTNNTLHLSQPILQFSGYVSLFHQVDLLIKSRCEIIVQNPLINHWISRIIKLVDESISESRSSSTKSLIKRPKASNQPRRTTPASRLYAYPNEPYKNTALRCTVFQPCASTPLKFQDQDDLSSGLPLPANPVRWHPQNVCRWCFARSTSSAPGW